MCILEKADVVDKPRLTIQARQIMFTIVSSAQGFHVVDSLPDGTTMSSTYFIDESLTKTAAAFFPDGGSEQSPTMTLYLDNCSVHRSRITKDFMEQNRIRSMTDPFSQTLRGHRVWDHCLINESTMKDINVWKMRGVEFQGCDCFGFPQICCFEIRHFNRETHLS
jgi:hypothetical protein